MKVLLVVRDLWTSVGGGQTVYKKIIESSPEIDFYYFRSHEPAGASRPANAHTLPLLSRCSLRMLAAPPHVGYVVNALQEADQIARSVAGQSFDVVDIPDFLTFGSVLKSAFAHHRVKVGRIVLAMHGNISDSMNVNWGSDGDRVLELRCLERAQFDAADGAYSISLRYMRSWQAIVDRDIHYIDPAHFVDASSPMRPWSQSSPTRPSLYCIGRSERRKGNDLFIEFVRWMDPSSFKQAAHIGNEDYSTEGISSDYILREIATRRGILVGHEGPRDHSGLLDLFASPCVALLPTRYDAFNLVALEALFSGSPLVISSKAGVCDYLDEAHPGLPYTKIDLDNFYSAVPLIRHLVENYDQRRSILHSQLINNPPLPLSSLNMKEVYDAALAAPSREMSWQHSIKVPAIAPRGPNGRNPHGQINGSRVLQPDDADVSYEEYSLSLKQRTLNLARQMVPRRWRSAPRPNLKALLRFFAERIKSSRYLGDARVFEATLDAAHLPSRLRNVAALGERNKDALNEKLGALYYHAASPLFRCNFWLDIARLERLRGNELMAAAYELRILRLLGHDRLKLLPRTIDALKKHGFAHEAEAAQAMYGDPARADEHVYGFLKQAFSRLSGYQAKPFEILDDRRSGEPKVAVVVSLYKAADKLNFFLTALGQQTLMRQDKVELILIDSGSPSNERTVLDAYLRSTPLNFVYARSQERETIQAAWNRGITLARAPYLVFLGVDETLYPEALETLAQELHKDSDVDWVMGNSLVTAVDHAGLYQCDTMPYDRTGAGKDHVYLETCYLSWVGGMYRKSLHDRFGYYDETFGAAGDTEFKSRILPYIKVKFIDRILGLFLNYPDGQTTMSPRAEIEDLRAWYIHRTPGGVRYAFENRPIEQAEALLRLALGYRKSYCRHISCDIEYALYLVQHIRARVSESPMISSVEKGLTEFLQDLRKLEFAPRMPRRLESIALMANVWRSAAYHQRKHRQVFGSSANPCYGVLNDNRHEQHSWLWKSDMSR